MQRSRLLLLAGAAAMALGFASTGAAARGPALILYQEDHFGGDSREIDEDQPDLGWIHFDDRVSSVEVHRGVWELCTDSRYRGRCITVDHDIGRLDRLGFDDRISSVHRLR
jgi:hypothetical protein